MSDPPVARIEGKHAVVAAPESKRLHTRFLVGDLQPDGSLRMSLAEAAWCALGDRIALESQGAKLWPGTLAAQAGEAEAIEAIVYGDLRERGLVVRHQGASLAVWPRGVGIEGEPAYRVQSVPETAVVTGADLLAMARGTVAAIVDSDGAVTHYKVQEEAPTGICHPSGIKGGSGTVVGKHVLVPDPAFAERLWASTYVGTKQGKALVLSQAEATWLHGAGILRIDPRPAWLMDSRTTAGATYQALRAAGIVPKAGFRFGMSWRGYQGDPDATHAEWLIDCLDAAQRMPWTTLARGIRLAHGVRKALLVAVRQADAAAAADNVRFVSLAWFRP